MKNSNTSFDINLESKSLRLKWGWFMALGVALVVLSTIAFTNLAIATQATILYVGALMFIGGVVQIVHVFQVRSWAGSSATPLTALRQNMFEFHLLTIVFTPFPLVLTKKI